MGVTARRPAIIQLSMRNRAPELHARNQYVSQERTYSPIITNTTARRRIHCSCPEKYQQIAPENISFLISLPVTLIKASSILPYHLKSPYIIPAPSSKGTAWLIHVAL